MTDGNPSDVPRVGTDDADMPAADPARTEAEYEFSEQHNRSFSTLARRMLAVGGAQIVVGVVYLAIGLLGLATGDPLRAATGVTIGIVLLLIGVWTMQASRHVGDIVSTTGKDITHLMRAVAELTRLYSFQRLVFLLTIVVGAAAFLLDATWVLEASR
jgi:hypothetical protein